MEYVKKFALDLLLENHISEIPYNIFTIKSNLKEWKFYSYLKGKPLIEELGCTSLCVEKVAFAVPVSLRKYFVFYDNNLSYDEVINAIAHEIGHIMLSHGAVGHVLGKSANKEDESRQEQEANAFAKYLLAPACVLLKAGITSIDEVIKTTALSKPLALEVVDEIIMLKKYITSPEEEDVCRQFKNYILKNKIKHYKRPFIRVLITVAASFLCFLIMSALMNQAQKTYSNDSPPALINAAATASTTAPEPTPATVSTTQPEPSKNIKVYTQSHFPKIPTAQRMSKIFHPSPLILDFAGFFVFFRFFSYFVFLPFFIRSNNRNGKSISERPETIEKRKERGHWEIDLVVGKQGTKPAVLTLVERLSRKSVYILIRNKTQREVIEALKRVAKRIGDDFSQVFKTIITDNGSEFLESAGIKAAAKCDEVYYAHPYSSWERGSNENGNRMLRRFIPKGTDMSELTETELQKHEDWVNNYPRRIFDYKSANEMYAA